MDASGVEVYLAGHAHGYERFAPQNAAGPGTRGGDQGVRGRHGRPGLQGFGTVVSNSEIRKNKIFGVMKLTLGATGYGWRTCPIRVLRSPTRVKCLPLRRNQGRAGDSG